MTPYEAVREEFDFPFGLYPFQIYEVDDLCAYDRTGFYWEPGVGKTAGVTHWCLSLSQTQGTQHWVILMPPILLGQWERWLKKITRKSTGMSPSVTVYSGTPKQREKLDLNVDFVLTSYGLFKNDHELLTDFYSDRKVGLVTDEGHALKNIGSQTYKSIREFATGRPLAILTGTPLTTPMDGYAYVKLIAPAVYRNLRQFENVHVGARDEYGTVTEWANLDLLASNMKIQTSRVLRRAVQNDLPPITFNQQMYDLAPGHLKLYKRIADEKLVEFDDGREINAISAQALYSALQQVVINWGEFEDDDSKEPAALDLIHEVFEELGPTAKLAVVANFIRSNRYLLRKLERYGTVALYGEVSAKDKQLAIKRFIEDPSCRCILLQPRSAGFGVDGLQDVCSDMVILEAPTIAPPFYQVAARLDRDGQKNPVNCRVATAKGTVQVRMFKSLLENDSTVNSVQGGFKDLKEAISGN